MVYVRKYTGSLTGWIVWCAAAAAVRGQPQGGLRTRGQPAAAPLRVTVGVPGAILLAQLHPLLLQPQLQPLPQPWPQVTVPAWPDRTQRSRFD